MDECETSDFQLIQKLPKSRAPLPRMADLRHPTENLSDYDEEDSSDYDEGDIVQEGYDNIDAPIQIKKHNRENLGYKTSEKNHTPEEELTLLLDSDVQDIRNTLYTKYRDARKAFEDQKSKNKPVGRTERHIFCWVVGFLIPVIVALFFMTNDSIADNLKNETKLHQSKIQLIENLERNINSISQTFKKQSPDIWVDFIAGVAEVVNYQNKPAIFFLFANRDDTMLCLAKMIANASKAALGSDNNLWLSASDMNSDYGTVIDKFKDKIEEQKIVIVDNLLNIDSKAMLAFHHLCDKENPLVKKAIYIITMVAEGYSEEQKPIQFVEDQLIHKMKDTINKDKLQPLITRITDGPIIPIQPEPDIRNCPLRY